MKRPPLDSFPLDKAIAETGTPGSMFITIDPGAWDALILASYKSGWTLLEIKNEKPVRAFKKIHLPN